MADTPSLAGGTGFIDGGNSIHWRRNLAVCTFGSFASIVAMTLLLPFLPLYVEQLGVKDRAAIVQWSGAAYGATFLAAALVAPTWGRLADRYGRKLMLVRASLGMAVAMPLIGMAHNVWQLVALRLLAGFLGGYSSGSTLLVATQCHSAQPLTPNRRRRQTPVRYLIYESPELLTLSWTGSAFGAYTGSIVAPVHSKDD